MQTYRTHKCGELRKSHVGQDVRISGWIHRVRDHGGVLFVDLRDHYGITQVVVNPGSACYQECTTWRCESVVSFHGKVIEREADTVNAKLATGEIEVVADQMVMLSESEITPFSIAQDTTECDEALRLKYRFLDLRREQMHKNIVLRSQVAASVRRRLTDLGFHEYQTPILTCSSPEGARDFLVPSRLHAGKFYALPQAPQIFKQLLMVSGFDRYFQIAPCFRDEDARADRSPGEFYQIDMEMSFVTQEEVFEVIEKLIDGIFTEFGNGQALTAPAYPRITYRDSMVKYGCDKPDLRIPLEIKDASGIFANTTFNAFKGILEKKGVIRTLTVPGAATQSRGFFDSLIAFAQERGGKGMAYIQWTEEGPKSPILKFMSAEEVEAVRMLGNAKPGDATFFIADAEKLANKIAGEARVRIGELLGLREKDVFRFCWVVDYPMYEWSDEEQRWDFSHNPFSMPQGGMDALMNTQPDQICAYQYDLVCNGIELSSGAIRNHRPDIMYKAFELCGYTKETVEKKFGGLLNAFRFGAPPHGGIAPGFDRILMLLTGAPNIREIIAFPLNQNGQDLLLGAPGEVTEKQLRELRIKLNLPHKHAPAVGAAAVPADVKK